MRKSKVQVLSPAGTFLEALKEAVAQGASPAEASLTRNKILF
jgi:hypothetical protein